MVNALPPYLPSLRWYAAWARAIADGHTDDEAIALANGATGVKGKDYVRATLPGQLLSVAIEGGSGRLKKGATKGSLDALEISLHGNWPHVHLGTLEALYGRTPYYQHLAGDLRKLIAVPPERLAELNRSLHRLLTSWLQIAPAAPAPEALARGRELLAKVDPDLTILDALMRVGPEISLLLPELAHLLAYNQLANNQQVKIYR